MRPAFDAGIELTRFTDACASLWIDGELVHLQVARDVLRTRRLIAGQLPEWALSPEGIRALRQTSEITSAGTGEAEIAGVSRTAVMIEREGEVDDGDDAKDLPGIDLSASHEEAKRTADRLRVI